MFCTQVRLPRHGGEEKIDTLIESKKNFVRGCAGGRGRDQRDGDERDDELLRLVASISTRR